MDRMKKERKIVLRDFYRDGKHVYEDMLGWRKINKEEARSLVSKEIYDFYVTRAGLKLGFYYLDDDNFYGINREVWPYKVYKLFRDLSEKHLGYQTSVDKLCDDGEVIASFDDENEIWDNLSINGKTLEEVLERSYIMALIVVWDCSARRRCAVTSIVRSFKYLA